MSRIPADQSSSFAAWSIPEVKDGQIVQTEKLQQRGPRGELVNVEKNEVIYNSITAAQLEEISNQAYEEIREQAREDGIREGREAGYQAGMEAAQQAIDQQTQRLSAAIDQLSHYLAGQDDEVEQALVNVATCIASAVIRRELTLDGSQIQQIIQEAIATLPMEASNLTVHLSEQDYQLMTSQADKPAHWQLKIDPSLSSGGCRVTTTHSVVDYTLEEQFQQTVNTLVESRFAELAAQAKQRADAFEADD